MTLTHAKGCGRRPVGAAFGLGLACVLGGPTAVVSPPPSFVVVTTDDQSSETLAAMPHTMAGLVTEGAVFANAVSSFPLCAPSRATFLTAPTRSGYTPVLED